MRSYRVRILTTSCFLLLFLNDYTKGQEHNGPSKNQNEELKHLGDVPLYQSDLFEGDIAEIPGDEYQHNNSIGLWPEGFVPYEIDPSLAAYNASIQEAFQEIQNKTCIIFQQRRKDDRDYLNFTKTDTGCSSSVGRRMGEQLVSLGRGCHWKGILLHLLGHSLGLWHEHTRPDRDNYIDILWENIESGDDNQFLSMSTILNNSYQHIVNDSFSYHSIMMYGETAFSKDDVSPTIRPKNSSIIIGSLWNRTKLDDSDVHRLNTLYQCPWKTEVSEGALSLSNHNSVPLAFHCDFEHDDCGIKNQPNMRSSFIRTSQPIGGRQSHFMFLDVTNHAHSHGARLITAYFPTQRYKTGCLSFRYFMDGKGIVSIVVTQQDRSNSEIWLTSGSTPQWSNAVIDVDLRRGNARFFIDALLEPQEREGIVGIDDISFRYNSC